MQQHTQAGAVARIQQVPIFREAQDNIIRKVIEECRNENYSGFPTHLIELNAEEQARHGISAQEFTEWEQRSQTAHLMGVCGECEYTHPMAVRMEPTHFRGGLPRPDIDPEKYTMLFHHHGGKPCAGNSKQPKKAARK